ncbi:unnamed protein product [Mytilus edulis]|uniref:Uncharacterized protein n=1 Tax=Mytilus edulis TaxID=6550 RepID=A0A8S3UCA7_MYTED|nr:unnamed protein product [Mytilus edulis]
MTSEIKKPKEPQIDIGVNAVKKVENKDLTEFTKSVMNCFQELNKRIDELIAASGENLKVYGKVKLPFKIDGVLFEHDFVVVELDNMSGILGIDLLNTSEAQLNISKALLIIPDETVIKLKKIQSNSCALIRLKERISNKYEENNMLIEPNAHLAKQGILISNALVNAKDNKVVISALNCTDRDITLKKLKVVGNIQFVSKISESLGCDKSDTEELPEHLKCMLEKVSSKLSKEQKEKIKRLIFNFQDIFLGPEGKLGRTELVKHTIDTGDARPIRIPPRRVALAQKDIISEEIEKMLKMT